LANTNTSIAITQAITSNVKQMHMMHVCPTANELIRSVIGPTRPGPVANCWTTCSGSKRDITTILASYPRHVINNPGASGT
ncbi:hypothetical protein PIB30_103782, partial [Stylosanthes scabra]|nr:hypothetical protein [Stylosanthes scabra]